MRQASAPSWGKPFRIGGFLSARTLVAGRPEAVAGFALPHFETGAEGNRDHILELRPLSYPAEVARFVGRFFSRDPDAGAAQTVRVMDRLDRASALQHAVALPFYLRLLCELARGHADAELPETATGVLNKAVYQMSVRRNLVRERGGDTRPFHDLYRHLLAAVAFAEVTTAGRPFVDDDALDAINQTLDLCFAAHGRTLRRSLQNRDSAVPDQIWAVMYQRTGLLWESEAREEGPRPVGVRDPRVRTFLAAKHLADLLDWYEPGAPVPVPWGEAKTIEAVVRAAAARVDWRDILIHLAGLIARPERLVWLLRALATADTDLSKPLLGVTCRCCGELSTKQRGLPDVQEQVNRVAALAWAAVTPLSALQMRISPVAWQIGHLINAGAVPTGQTRSLIDLILDRVERGD